MFESTSHGELPSPTTIFCWHHPRAGEAIREVPTAGPRRSWSCACATPSGRVMRLANKWRRHPAGHMEWTSELLLPLGRDGRDGCGGSPPSWIVFVDGKLGLVQMG